MADTPDTTDQAPALPSAGQPDSSQVPPEDRQGMLAHAVNYYAQNGEQFWGPGSMSYTQARVPGLSAAQDIDYYSNLYRSAQALQGGGGDREDIYRVAAHLGKQQYEATRTGFGQRILDIGSHLPGAVAEWEMTGGAAGGAKAAAEEMVGGIAKKYLGSLAGKVATKAAGYAAEGVARSALMPSTYGDIAQQTVGQDEQGNVAPQSLGMATIRGGATAVIQNTINAGAGTFAPKEGGSILRSTAQAVGAGQLTKEALYQLALSGKPSEIHDLITSENKGEAIKALGAEAVAFGGLEGFMHAVPKIAARRAELQKAGVPDNSPQMQQELQKTASDLQNQAPVETPKPGRLPGGGIEPIIGPDGKDEFGRPAQPPAPEAPQAPPSPPEAPPAQPPAEAPPAAPEAAQPPQTARQRADDLEQQHLDVTKKLMQARQAETQEKANKGMGLKNDSPGATLARKALEKQQKALSRALDQARVEAAADVPWKPDVGGEGHPGWTYAEAPEAQPARQSWNHAATKFTDTAEGATEFAANGKPYRIAGNLGTAPSDGKPYLDVRAVDPATGEEHGRLLLDRKEGAPGSTDYSAAELRVHPSLRGKENTDTRRAVVNGLYDFAHEQLGELKASGAPEGGEITPSQSKSEGGKAVWARNASLKAGEEGPPPEPAEEPKTGAVPSGTKALAAKILSRGMKVKAEPGATAGEGVVPESREQKMSRAMELLDRASDIARTRRAGMGDEAAQSRELVEKSLSDAHYKTIESGTYSTPDEARAEAMDTLEEIAKDHGLITHHPEVDNAIKQFARDHSVSPESVRAEVSANLQARAEQTRTDAANAPEAGAPAGEPGAGPAAEAGGNAPAGANLTDLAAKAIPRKELQARGFRNLAKSTDLFEHGYSISHWFNPATKEEIVEYNPRQVAGEPENTKPRLTATNYDEQKAVHEAIGAPVVGPGENVSPKGQRTGRKLGAAPEGGPIHPDAYEAYRKGMESGRSGKVGTVGDFLQGNDRADRALSEQAKNLPVRLDFSRPKAPAAWHNGPDAPGGAAVVLNASHTFKPDELAFALAHESAHAMRTAAGRPMEYQQGVPGIEHAFEQSANRLGEHVSGISSEEMEARIKAQQKPALSPQERMRRGQKIPKQYEAKAVEQGISPDDLHTAAIHNMAEEKAAVDDHNQMLREAWRALKEFNVTPLSLARHEDPAKVDGFDEVAEKMAQDHPSRFNPQREDPTDTLFNYLRQGMRKPAGGKEAYEQALEQLTHIKGLNDETQEARDEGHSPAEVAENLRAGVQDGEDDARDEAEPPHAPGDEAGAEHLGAADFNPAEFDTGPEPGAAPGASVPNGTEPAGPGDERVNAALARYDNRDVTARGGGLFGGEDLQTREGFGRLPDGAPVVIAEGDMRGQTGTIGRDEQGHIGVAMEGRPGLVNVDPAAIEPLNPWQSWRTSATTAPVQQGGLFSAESFLGKPKEGIPPDGAFNRFMTSEDASLPLEKYEEVYKGVVDFFRKLNGAKAPRTARLSTAAADAIAHYDSAGDRARLTAPLMLDKVLGKNAPDVLDELAGAVRTERALRYTHDSFMQESAKASQAAAQLRAQAAADKAAGYQQHPADVWQQMVKAKADRATEMLRKAKDVTSIIGQKAIPDQGIPESPLKSYADYQKALANPEVQKADAAWMDPKNGMVPIMEDNFRRAQGMDVTDPINSLTQIPDNPTNLKPVSLEAPGVGGRGNLANLKLGKFKFAKERAGNADAYDFRLSSIIDNSLNHGFANAAKAEMFRTIEAEGLGTWAKPGQGPEGTQAIPFVAPPAGTQEAQAGETTFYAHPQVAGELRQVLGVDMPTPKLPGTGLLNAVAVASLVEPVTHIKNQLSMFNRPGMSPADYVGHALSVMAKDGGVMGRIAELAGLDVQARQERAAQLAGIGSAGAPGQMGRLLPERFGKYDPTAWLGKAIEVSDLAMRLTADDAFTRLTKTKSILTGKPLVEDTETNRRDFINQLGNYSKRSQSKLVAFLRDVGLGPFATAGANFNVMAMKDVMMDPGVKATSTGAAVELRMRMLGRTIAMMAAVPMLNYLLWKRMDGDDKTPLGSIKVGAGSDGATRYVPVANWMGLDRGAKLLGIDAMAEGARTNRPVAHSADKAVQDAVEQWTHPAIGPSAQAAYTAYTGKNTLGMQLAPKAKPKGSQEWENFKTAAANWNPVVAALVGANRPASQKGKPLTAATVAENLAGPFLKERKTPPGKDLSMMRR